MSLVRLAHVNFFAATLIVWCVYWANKWWWWWWWWWTRKCAAWSPTRYVVPWTIPTMHSEVSIRNQLGELIETSYIS